MPKLRQFHYLALLGNVDRSILQVTLGDDFRLVEWSSERFVSFYERMHGSAEHDILYKLDEDWGYGTGRIYRSKTVYVVEKRLPDFPTVTATFTSHGEWWDQFHGKMAFEESQSALLEEKIKKLRLCGPGAIKICVEFFYSADGVELEMESATEESLHGSNRLFKVKKSDLSRIHELLGQPPLSRAQKYLAFALDNYNQSYRVAQLHLEFLTLMLALEAIFNDGKQELRNKVSRGGAVLMGRTKEESRRIFKSLRDLYDKRSVLVHTGDTSKVDDVDVQQLHACVRESLVRALVLDLPKDKFTAALQEAGFGQRNALSKSVRKATK